MFCSCICGLWKNLRQRNPEVQAGSSNFTTNCITRERNKHFWLTHVNRFIKCLDATKFASLRLFTLIETICRKMWAKPSPKNAKRPHRSQINLLKTQADALLRVHRNSNNLPLSLSLMSLTLKFRNSSFWIKIKRKFAKGL